MKTIIAFIRIVLWCFVDSYNFICY